MSNEAVHSTVSSLVLASPSSKKSPPSWLAEAITLLNLWKHRGYVAKVQGIHWNRPSKRYEFCDLVLVLLALSVSKAAGIRHFYREVKGWEEVLASVWGRERLPSRSHLSRLFRAVTEEHLELLRLHFLDDLVTYLPSHARGGMIGHDGQRHFLFDMDPTKMATRERQLPESEQRPAGQRLRTESAAPGYPGRKRAQSVRSRTTVYWPHAGMWLLSFGQQGNGKHDKSLSLTCQQILSFIARLGISAADAFIRMDGEWGHLKYLLFIKRQGLGFLTRIGDYRVLRLPQVQDALAQGTTVQFQSPDSPVQREIFDIPDCCWEDSPENRLEMRLIVTRRKARTDGKKERVGCRIGGYVYEAFGTDRSVQSLRAEEAVDLYLNRGAFEAVLGQEDAEMETDRWLSNFGTGEDVWQIICQWVWNQRVQLGLHLEVVPKQTERILAFETEVETIAAIPVQLEFPEKQKTPKQEKQEKQKKPPRTKKEREKKKQYWGPEKFRRDEQGDVWCPLGFLMRRVDGRLRVRGWRERYEAPVEACATCEQCQQCRRPGHSTLSGRKVDLPIEPRDTRSAEPVEDSSSDQPRGPMLEPTGRSEEQVDVLEKPEGASEQEWREANNGSCVESEPMRVESPEQKEQWTGISEKLKSAENQESASSVVLAVEAKEGREPVVETNPILLWYDIAASLCRRLFCQQLRGEQVKVSIEEIAPLPLSEQQEKRETRDQRAHRRRSWSERLQRNARPTNAPRMVLEITGIPLALAKAVGAELRGVSN